MFPQILRKTTRVIQEAETLVKREKLLKEQSVKVREVRSCRRCLVSPCGRITQYTLQEGLQSLVAVKERLDRVITTRTLLTSDGIGSSYLTHIDRVRVTSVFHLRAHHSI